MEKKSCKFYECDDKLTERPYNIESDQQNSEKLSIRGIFYAKYLPIIFISTIIILSTERSGRNEILLYSTMILNFFGIEISTAQSLTVLLKIVAVFSNFLCCLFINKIGRKKLYLILIGICALNYTFIASNWFTSIFNFKIPGVKWINAAFLGLSFILFEGIVGVCYILLPEILPVEIRVSVKSMLQFLTAIIAIIMTSIFEWCLNSFGYLYFFTFSLLQGIFFIILFWMMPETLGKTNQ